MLFGKRELIITNDLKRLVELRNVLEANNIPYQVRTDSSVRARTRGHSPGALGIDLSKANLHKIYVHKNDLDKAKHLINIK